MKQTAQTPHWNLTQKHCIFIILLVAAVLRLPGLSGEWQYDEIWTLFNFTDLSAGQILTDVSLPNNHPVNTLLMKLLKNFSTAPQIIRLGVFISGIYVVFMAMKLAGRAGNKNKIAVLCAGILSAFSPALILFSVVARGYIFQIAGLMLCVDRMLDVALTEKNRYTVWKIIAGGVVAFLAVSSGIMFLGVIAAGYLLLAPKEYRWDKSVLISGVVLLVVALSYYLPLYDQLRAGQQWGNEIDSFSGLISFGFTTLKAHLPVFTALPVLSGVIFLPVMRKVFLFSLLPLILALFTKAGPERVYLPLTVVFIIIGACGAAEVWKRSVKYRKVLIVLFCCGIILDFKLFPEVWILPAPAAAAEQIIAENTDTVLPVLASTSGFPVLFNVPEIAKIIESRAVFPEKLLMLNCSDGVFNGADAANSEQQMSFPVSGVFKPGGVPGYMYGLVPVEKIAAGETALMIFPGKVPEEFMQLPGKKLRLNLWLNRRYPLYVCNFLTADIPYFEGVKYFRVGEKND